MMLPLTVTALHKKTKKLSFSAMNLLLLGRMLDLLCLWLQVQAAGRVAGHVLARMSSRKKSAPTVRKVHTL